MDREAIRAELEAGLYAALDELVDRDTYGLSCRFPPSVLGFGDRNTDR